MYILQNHNTYKEYNTQAFTKIIKSKLLWREVVI